MKHNWTYKKLGEVVTIERGGSPRPIQDYITTAENGLNWIKIGDAVEGSKYITSTKEKIKPEGLKKTRFVHKGDFILSNSMSFGRPYILAIDGCIHDGWLVLHDENQVFDKSYLYYYLSSSSIYEEFKRLAVGGVVNNLNSDIVRKVKVAIPSLSEQQAIVRELDGINRLIDLQEEQLREYDRLAQSLFYTTFGDPTTNPKGWEVKKLGDISTVKIGPFGSLLHTSDYIKGGVPLVNPIHMKNGYIVADDNFTISEPKAEELRSYRMSSGDFIFARRGDIGRCAIVTEKEDGFLCGTGSLFVRFDGSVVPIYALFWTKCESFVKELTSKAKGATMLNINCGIVENLLLPLPPLALQQSFAAQIEAIEQQKALIRRSLDETRTLLAARMQYYFE